MNYVEALLHADAAKANEKKTAVFKSHRLGKILGLDGAADVTITEVNPRRIHQLIGRHYDKKGNYDFEKSYDANCAVLAEGMVEPPLKDKGLQDHFGAPTPAELAARIFAGEVSKIAMAIIKLSGVEDDDDEEGAEEIKNL
jgi:hypothetical protein